MFSRGDGVQKMPKVMQYTGDVTIIIERLLSFVSEIFARQQFPSVNIGSLPVLALIAIGISCTNQDSQNVQSNKTEPINSANSSLYFEVTDLESSENHGVTHTTLTKSIVIEGNPSDQEIDNILHRIEVQEVMKANTSNIPIKIVIWAFQSVGDARHENNPLASLIKPPNSHRSEITHIRRTTENIGDTQLFGLNSDELKLIFNEIILIERGARELALKRYPLDSKLREDLGNNIKKEEIGELAKTHHLTTKQLEEVGQLGIVNNW